MQLYYSFILIVYISSVSSEQEGNNIKSSIPKKQSVPIGYSTISPYSSSERVILKSDSNERNWKLLNKRSADPKGHHHSHGHIHVHTHIHKHKREISREPRRNQRLSEMIYRLTDTDHTKTRRKMNGFLSEVKDFIELENNYIDQATTFPEKTWRTRRSSRTHSHIPDHRHNNPKSSGQQNLNQLEENSPTGKNPGPTTKTHSNFEQYATTPVSNSRLSVQSHGIHRRAIPEDISRNLDKQQNLIEEEKRPENFSGIITKSYGDILDQIMKNVYKHESTKFIEIEGNQIDQDANNWSPISGVESIPDEHFLSNYHVHIHPHGAYKREISEDQYEISENPKSREKRSPGKHNHSHGHIHVHTHGAHKREILMATNNNMNQDQAEKLMGRRDFNTKIRVHSKIIHAEKNEGNGRFLRSPKVMSRRKRDLHSHGHAHFHTFSSFSEEVPDIPQAAIKVEYPKPILKVFGVKRSDHHGHTHSHYHAHSHNIFKRESDVQVRQNENKNDDNISLNRGVLTS